MTRGKNPRHQFLSGAAVALVAASATTWLAAGRASSQALIDAQRVQYAQFLTDQNRLVATETDALNEPQTPRLVPVSPAVFDAEAGAVKSAYYTLFDDLGPISLVGIPDVQQAARGDVLAHKKLLVLVLQAQQEVDGGSKRTDAWRALYEASADGGVRSEATSQDARFSAIARDAVNP